MLLARSPALYRTRITNSIALLCLGAGFSLVYHYAGSRALAQVLPMLTFVLLMVCLFAGVHLTADSIAREKREGTLGLLFLTHLTPFQIVMGKLIAHGLMGFYAVLIVVPLLSMVMIGGGVRLLEVATFAIAALNTLFFSSAVGLWASSRHIDRKKAGSAGTWVVIFFWWGIPIIVQTLNYFQAPTWLVDGVGILGVNGMFNSVFAGPRIRWIQSPWVNLATTHLLAWIFVGLSIFYLKHRWQDAPAKEKFIFREWWKRKSLGSPRVRYRLRKRLLDRNPFLWLACRDRWRSVGLWSFTIVFLGVIAWQLRHGWTLMGPVLVMLITMCMVLKVMVAAGSAHQLSTEQEQGTLEMLLSTPLETETVLRGQIMATTRQFRGPVLLWMLAAGTVILAILGWEPFGGFSKAVAFAFGVNAMIHLLELYTMIWAGMWGAVTVKDAKNAAGAAMARIIGLPAIIFGLLFSSWSLANWYWKWGLGFNPVVIVGLYFLLCIANSFCWLVYFKRALPNRLREFALKRYAPEEPTTLWSTLGRAFGKMRARPRRGTEPPKLGVAGPVQN